VGFGVSVGKDVFIGAAEASAGAVDPLGTDWIPVRHAEEIQKTTANTKRTFLIFIIPSPFYEDHIASNH
jgi:hypothetical protein